MPSDLHTHTNFSDGKLSPEELLMAAKAAKLKYIAITDHDTVDGIRYLYENGLFPSRAVKVIPGIEFSAHHPTREVHILGYNIDIYNSVLLDKLNEVTDARWSRFTAIVGRLQTLGYAITEAEVLKVAGTSKSISRSHIARVLVKKNFFPTVRAAFSEVLEKGRPAYVSHYRLEVREIIELIKAAGGTPVLAHPKLIFDDELVETIIAQGIEGVEAYYPRHDENDTARYLAMAKHFNILVTGGSDFHGFASREPTELGIFTVPDEIAEPLYKNPL